MSKIVDFGIASYQTEEAQNLTKTGEIFGSPYYMSPEQCGGKKTDQTADIYSLGCMMYEALCGRPPFVGDTALSTCVMHLSEAPAPLPVPYLSGSMT